MSNNIIYSNRGMAWESFIEFANNCYKKDGIAVIEKQPTPFKPLWDKRKKKIANCKVEEKATVDYIGRYYNVPVAIEAKNSTTNTISFDRVKSHQQDFLEAYSKDDYGFSGVLVSFKMERFFLVPWIFWKAAVKAWEEMSWEKKIKGKSKKICVEVEYKGQTWITPGKASVRVDELLPEWEIHTDRRLGLPYLNKIDGYMNVVKSDVLEINGKLL